MSRVIDYAWGRPSVAALRGAGAVAVCRYLSYDRTGKTLTKGEADELRANGIDIVSNWEQAGSWAEYSGGQTTGRSHAAEASRQHLACGGPPGRPIYFSTDWDATSTQLPTIAEYYRGVASVIGLDRTGAYGSYRTVKYLLDQGVIRWGWQTYAWSSYRDNPTGQIYLHWDPRAQLRQVRNGVAVGGGDCDLDESMAGGFGQWGAPSMTTAPADLVEIQHYCHDRTGQEWGALGIIHGSPQGGGYHEGEDLLIAAGRAPGPQYPHSDYSYADAPARDLYPNGRLAGGNYASAFDLGGGFPRRLEFNIWMLGRLQANDPRARDIREMIYTPDGTVVRRFDRTGKQANSGDSTHLSHTHFSFFRDSQGRRAGDDNFLGLLKEFFEGTEGTDYVGINDTDAAYLTWRVEAITHMFDTVRSGPEKGSAVDIVRTVKSQSTLLAAVAADVAGIKAAVAALAAVIATGGGDVDVAAILARIDDAQATESAAVAALHAELVEVRQQLARAAQAAVGELTGE